MQQLFAVRTKGTGFTEARFWFATYSPDKNVQDVMTFSDRDAAQKIADDLNDDSVEDSLLQPWKVVELLRLR